MNFIEGGDEGGERALFKVRILDCVSLFVCVIRV